jgi:hypothetical protein
MKNPFKCSKFKRSKLSDFLILSGIELLNPLNLERTVAQANVYQTGQVIIRTASHVIVSA